MRPIDYHKVLLKRLDGSTPPPGSLGPFESSCYVDTGPLVERVYARYAGLGWTGKNTCILNQQLGSWLFLGVILTSLELPADRTARTRRRPLRKLHPLHRCLPHGGAHRSVPDGREPLHLLPDH